MVNDSTGAGLFICFLKLGCDRHWSRSVLGKKIDIRIGGRVFHIYTPKLGQNWEELGPLVAPDIVRKYRYENGPIICGMTDYAPSGQSRIETVVIVSDVKNKLEAENLAIAVNRKIFYYTELFSRYVMSISGHYEIYPSIAGNSIADYCYEDGVTHKSVHLDSKGEIEIKLVENSGKVPTFKDVRKAIKMMEAEVIIPLEFEYYIDALIALEKGDNRKCVLDSATAVEISLTKKIESILTSQASFVHVKELLDDYQGLNKRFSLLRKINGNVSGLNIKTLNENRNKIIHAGQKVELAVASKVLVDAKRVLDRFSKFW